MEFAVQAVGVEREGQGQPDGRGEAVVASL